MNRLFAGALVVALSTVPVISRAETPSREAAAPAARDAYAGPASDETSQTSDDETSDYAARENAAPQLEEFAGGDNGVYIGSGVLVAALIVVLLLAL
jgi:hypothetical protein